MKSRSTIGRALFGFVLPAVLAFLYVATIGAGEAARDERVLSFLDPVINHLRRLGLLSLQWLVANAANVAWVVTDAAFGVALIGLALRPRRSGPLLLLAAAISLAAWGQALLVADSPHLGAWLYAAAALCGVGVGIWCPMTTLPGFPSLPLPDRQRRDEALPTGLTRSRIHGAEFAVVLVLTLLALLTRTYALTEHPRGFDLETVSAMILSRNTFGLRRHFLNGFLQNAPGMVHLFTQKFLFDVFGTSLYSLRLAAVLWGTAAVPLLYWLVRRLAGVAPAVVAAVLCLVAPEQLFWSRTENTFFAPVAALAIITAHLALWMTQRFSPLAVLVNALWMPFCRYFYSAGMVLFALPLSLYGHAMLCVRGAWRKAWYVVPLLAGGLALWIFSLSIAFSTMEGSGWRFVHPAMVYGAPAWNKQGEIRDSGIALLRQQAVSIAANLADAARGMTYDNSKLVTHWYSRYNQGRNTSLNVGLAAVLALGAAYLLGQIRDRRAALLLAWLALGLAPGLLSKEAAVRRMIVVFPAMHATAAIMIVAGCRIVRSRAGNGLARVSAALLAAAVAGIAGTSLASHFLLDIGPFTVAEQIRFAAPLFRECDLLLDDIAPARRRILLFGNLDMFLGRGAAPALQSVETSQWLTAALHPRCDFSEEAYGLIMPAEQITALQDDFAPRRICFLTDVQSSRLHVDLLRELFPNAGVRNYQNPRGEGALMALSVDSAEIEALRHPQIQGPSQTPAGVPLESALLADVALGHAPTDSIGGPGERVTIRGGIVTEHDGWYRFDLEPPCPAAALTIDNHRFPSDRDRPMLAGVHPFSVELPDASSCRLPLRIVQHDQQSATSASVGEDHLVGPQVANLSDAMALPVATYAGYGSARRVAQIEGEVKDLGVDADGKASVGVWQSGQWRVHRFAADGREETSWPVEFPGFVPGPNNTPRVVMPDGTSIFVAEHTILLYDEGGKRIGAWDLPWSDEVSALAVWQRDRLLVAVPRRQAIAVFSLTGELQGELREFTGGPGRFNSPVGLAVGPNGLFLVMEYADGRALLFSNAGENWNPRFVKSFSLDSAVLPFEQHAAVFDGKDRVIVPDRVARKVLVYSAAGTRLLAADRTRDLNSMGFGNIAATQPTTDRLYLIDQSDNSLWAIER